MNESAPDPALENGRWAAPQARRSRWPSQVPQRSKSEALPILRRRRRKRVEKEPQPVHRVHDGHGLHGGEGRRGQFPARRAHQLHREQLEHGLRQLLAKTAARTAAERDIMKAAGGAPCIVARSAEALWVEALRRAASFSRLCWLFSSVQLSHVQLFATPWTAARQASLSTARTKVPCG